MSKTYFHLTKKHLTYNFNPEQMSNIHHNVVVGSYNTDTSGILSHFLLSKQPAFRSDCGGNLLHDKPASTVKSKVMYQPWASFEHFWKG